MYSIGLAFVCHCQRLCTSPVLYLARGTNANVLIVLLKFLSKCHLACGGTDRVTKQMLTEKQTLPRPFQFPFFLSKSFSPMSNEVAGTGCTHLEGWNPLVKQVTQSIHSLDLYTGVR